MASQITAFPQRTSRLLSLDVLRGLIMLLMALDHVRDFFSNARFSPLDLAHTTPALFTTRWITHLCAPGFVLLAGLSACLWAASPGRSRAGLARFLLTRGLWLIFLELTVVRLAWFLDLDYEVSLAQVIWVIGWSMIALAGMVFLPDWLILALVVAMIAGHNLLDPLAPPGGDMARALWDILHRPALLHLWPRHSLYVLYPVLPWPGVMGLGYLLGRWFEREVPRRSLWLVGLGIAFLIVFMILRVLNIYGDPGRWYPQRNALFTFFSFINLEKYPPSLLFLLVTLGVNLIALGFLDRAGGVIARIFAVYGRVPLFYYVIHLFVIHLSAAILALMRYGSAEWLSGSAWFFREGYPPDYGYGLGAVYLIWILVAAAIYPLCKWFGALKARRRDAWLSYL